MALLFWLSLSLIAYTYVLYPLVAVGLALVRRRTRPSASRVETDWPPVAVLIAVYNEEAVIGRKLENCLALDYPPDRVTFLFGSDGSSDATERLIGACPDPRVRLNAYPRQGKAATLNQLALATTAPILVFSDANSMFEPAAVRWLVQPFQEADVGGVCGRLQLHAPGAQVSGEARYWQYENLLKQAEGELGVLASANGAIYAIRRALYQPLPTHKRVADDLIVAGRVLLQGYRMVFQPQAVAHEETAATNRLDLRRKIRVAEISFNAALEISDLLWPGRGLAALMLWSHKVLRWSVPGLLIVVLAANLTLADQPFYQLALAAQLGGYVAALLGAWLEWRGRPWRWLTLFYYFAGANLALLIGLGRALTQRGGATWERVGR